jgi:antitoxin component YwqK of YwqJK toxin-antitoxin module
MLSISYILISEISTGQDTIVEIFNEKPFSNIDLRDYNHELLPLSHASPAPRKVYSRNESGYYILQDTINNLVRSRGLMIDGYKSGKWRYFDSSGQLRIEDSYANNIDSTISSTYFDPKGALIKTIEYSTVNSILRLYNSYGLKLYISKNNNGDEFHVSYDSLGRITYQVEYVNGKKHGTHLWRHNDGSIHSRQYYLHGKKTGIWISSFIGDSSVWCTQKFEDDKILSIAFYEDEIVIDKGEMTITDYYEDGSIRLQGLILNGIKTGTWLFYSSSGEIQLRVEHDEFGNTSSWGGKINGIPPI